MCVCVCVNIFYIFIYIYIYIYIYIGYVDKDAVLDDRALLQASDGKGLDAQDLSIKLRCQQKGMGMDLVVRTTEILRQ